MCGASGPQDAQGQVGSPAGTQGCQTREVPRAGVGGPGLRQTPLTLPLSSHGVWGKLLYLLEPPFSHLSLGSKCLTVTAGSLRSAKSCCDRYLAPVVTFGCFILCSKVPQAHHFLSLFLQGTSGSIHASHLAAFTYSKE